MLFRKISLLSFVLLVIGSGGIVSTLYSTLPQGFIDSTEAVIDTLRKRDCSLTITCRSQALAAHEIAIRQLNNHFGFGASIGKKWFTKTDSAVYGDAFRSYFDWATPENEMKWDVSEEMSDYQDYKDADWLIAWCDQHNIKVRGHNLFWNEKREWMPDWVIEQYSTDTAGFKAAMKRRIDSAMVHFKDKVAHWDLINEIVHGESGLPERPGLLVTLSGDTNVFSWVFKEARAIDPVAKLGVNEFNIIEKTSAVKEYIEEIKSIESKGAVIDIIGIEGHFGDYVERSDYQKKIDTIVQVFPEKELWLTEVDFMIDTLLRADKMEELMRTCFAHPHIGGLVLWVWWEGNRWREYTSFLVDSNYTENELGERWRTVRNGWKTTTSGSTTQDGLLNFRGFHGEYVVSAQFGDSIFCDTFSLDPGQGPQTISVDLTFSMSKTGVARQKSGNVSRASFRFSGKTVTLALTRAEEKKLCMSVYTVSGRLLLKKPVVIENGVVKIAPELHASGCHVVHIGTSDRTLFCGVNAGLQ